MDQTERMTRIVVHYSYCTIRKCSAVSKMGVLITIMLILRKFEMLFLTCFIFIYKASQTLYTSSCLAEYISNIKSMALRYRYYSNAKIAINLNTKPTNSKPDNFPIHYRCQKDVISAIQYTYKSRRTLSFTPLTLR